MLPMREPVTELDARDARRGSFASRADCAERQGEARDVPERAGVRRATSTPRSRCPHLGTVTVDVAYGGMFYVIADADAFGLRLTPDEGGDIVRIGEMIKAAAREQCPIVHPGATRASTASRSRSSRAAARDDADWQNAVVVSTGELDWNRPVHVDGRASTARPAAPARARRWPRSTRRASSRSTRTSGTRASSARLHRPARRGDAGRQVPGRRADAGRAGVDHRDGAVRRRSRRSVPGGVHRRRYLVRRHMSYRVGMDIGGTFTDFVVLDESAQTTSSGKVLSTPANPAEGVLQGLQTVVPELPAIGFLVHGTTVGLNAFLERKGTRVLLLMTEGCPRRLLDRTAPTARSCTRCSTASPSGSCRGAIRSSSPSACAGRQRRPGARRGEPAPDRRQGQGGRHRRGRRLPAARLRRTRRTSSAWPRRPARRRPGLVVRLLARGRAASGASTSARRPRCLPPTSRRWSSGYLARLAERLERRRGSRGRCA